MKLQLDLSDQEWDALRAALDAAVLQAQRAAMGEVADLSPDSASHEFVFLRNIRDYIDDLVDAHNAKYGVDPWPVPDGLGPDTRA